MNQWYCVEFYAKIDSTGGIFRMWVDGVLVLERTGLNTASVGNIAQVRAGLVYVYAITTGVSVYSDCFVLSNTYVGTEGIPIQYMLHVEVGGSGSTNATGDNLYNDGTSVAISASANSGWVLSHWLRNGTNVGSANPYTLTMNANYNLTAVFVEVPQYQLHVGIAGSGVTNATGDNLYDAGINVAVQATAGAGYKLSHWLLNSTNIGSANPYTLTMNANYNLTVVFVESTSTAIFEDGFESGSTSAWNSTATATSGETVTVSNEQAQDGTYSLRSTSNGGGGTESARAIETFSPTLSQIRVQGYFKLTQNGIVDNSDRIKLIELRSGSTIVAAAGLWQSGGTLRWWVEVRNGASWVETYTSQIGSFDLTQWFSVELYWKLGATDGGVTLKVNGNQIYQISNYDTDNYGNVSTLRFGLAELTNCGNTTLYSDLLLVSDL